MSNLPNSIGERLSEVLNKLKNLKKISGDRDISELLGYKSASSITEMKKNRAAPTTELLNLLSSNYGVSAGYILEGTGDMFNNPGVTIEDYESKTIAMIIKMDAKTDVILSALAEILAKQNGQLSKTTSDNLLALVNSLIQDKTKELQLT
jgi:transcriptional regulator with XRE-family HTH domain